MKASDVEFAKVILKEGSAPATPASGNTVIYVKPDGRVYTKDDAGAETLLGAVAAPPAVVALTSASGVLACNLASADYFTHTMSENTTLTLSNLPAAGKAQTASWRFKQHASAAKTLTLPASFFPTDGSDTAIGTITNGFTLLVATTFDQGTRWEYSMKACG